MVRSFIGGLIAGVVMFVIGFVFWGTPLSGVAFNQASDADSAVVQTALAQGLTRTGTGTYLIPTPSTPQDVLTLADSDRRKWKSVVEVSGATLD